MVQKILASQIFFWPAKKIFGQADGIGIGYLKQDKTKKSCEKSFREDRLKFFPYKTSCERKARITK